MVSSLAKGHSKENYKVGVEGRWDERERKKMLVSYIGLKIKH